MATLDRNDEIFSRLPENVVSKIFNREIDIPARCCKACSKKENKPSEMMQCPGCEGAQVHMDSTFYCNAECQRRDWPAHRYLCLGMADYLLENSEQTIIAILVDRRLRFWEEINKDLVAWMLKHAFFFNPNYDPWDYRFEIGLHRGNLTIQSVQFQERNDKQEHTWDSVNPRQQFTYSIVLLKTDPVYSITSVKPGIQLLRPQAEEMCPEWLAVAAHISAYHDLNRLSISTKLALLHSALLIQRQACESRFKNFETPPIGSEFAINIRALSGWIQTLRSIDLWTPIVESGEVESIMEESLDKQHDKQRTE